jgi:hypothetical protein
MMPWETQGLYTLKAAETCLILGGSGSGSSSSTGEASSPDDHHWLASRVAGYRSVVE